LFLEQFVSVGAACPVLRGDRHCFGDLSESLGKSILKVRDPVAFAASDYIFEILSQLVKHELEGDDDRLSFVTLISPHVCSTIFQKQR
jgi:hypothetical protein